VVRLDKFAPMHGGPAEGTLCFNHTCEIAQVLCLGQQRGKERLGPLRRTDYPGEPRDRRFPLLNS
jgi:hypothetical protein